MTTYSFIGHNLSVNGGNINVTSGATFSLVLTDDDSTIGDPGDTGEMVSVDGATAETYTFLGIGTTDVGETMVILELADGTLIGFNTDGTALTNGNTKVKLSDLVDDPIVPCFTPGMQILTPDGYVLVENLQEGDLIQTRDNGAQPARKILLRDLRSSEMTEELKPICVSKGALGTNLPFSDITVSPQHRFCISDWRAQLIFGENEVLATAKSLCNDNSIRRLNDIREVTYIHIILDDHQIITANGLETETVLLSQDFLDGMPLLVRLELDAVLECPIAAERISSSKAAAPILSHYEGTLISGK